MGIGNFTLDIPTCYFNDLTRISRNLEELEVRISDNELRTAEMRTCKRIRLKWNST